MKVWTWKDDVKADLIKRLAAYRQKGAEAISMPLLLSGPMKQYDFTQETEPCLNELINDGIVGLADDNGVEGVYLIKEYNPEIKRAIINALQDGERMTKAKMINRKRFLQKCLVKDIDNVLSELVTSGQIIYFAADDRKAARYGINPKYKGDAINE